MDLNHPQVTSVEPAYPVTASCPLRVIPPLGLTVLHPPSQNGTLYLQHDNTRLLLRVQSHYQTEVSQRGRTNQSATFMPACPPEYIPGLCRPGSSSSPGTPGVDAGEPSLFAVLDLGLGEEHQSGPAPVELVAHNEVTQVNLTVPVWLEKPLNGLVVLPHPTNRVLMESVVVSVSTCVHVCVSLCVHMCVNVPYVHVFVSSQSYSASVKEGSNPTFKWTVDDKPHFTYYNTVLNVIYQHPAVYKLTVSLPHRWSLSPAKHWAYT